MDDLTRLDCAMTAVLSRMTARELALVPAARRCTFSEMCDLAKTKRYAHARIRRMLCSAFLGLEKQPRSLPGFSRVLAFNDRGRKVLARLPQTEEGPVFLTKPASARRLTPAQLAEFELEARAADAYDLALPAYAALRPGREWTRGPVYVRP